MDFSRCLDRTIEDWTPDAAGGKRVSLPLSLQLPPLFTREQREPARRGTLRPMKTTYVNATVAALSMIAAGAVGLLAPVTTPSGWFVLALAATTPPLLFMRYSKPPTQTMSQSIQEVLR